MKISKKSKSVLYILGALLLLVYGGNYFQNGTFSIGFAPMSLSSVDFLSNDPLVAGKAWLLTVALNGNGQYAVSQGVFDSSQVKDSADAVSSKYALTLRAETSPITCRYSIDNKNKAEPIYSLSSTYMGYSLTEIVTHTYENQCNGYADAYRFWRNGAENYCFRKTQIGTHGALNTPSTIWTATITATKADGTSESKTISNIGTTSTWLGTNVYVSWNGDMVSAEQCPVTNIPDVVFKDGAWKTTSNQKWIDYKAYYDTSGGFDNCIGTYKNADSCTNDFNIKATNAVVVEPLSMYSAEGKTYSASTGGSSIDSGQVDLVVDKQLRNPSLSFKIKADWIGIVQDVGIPDITSANNIEFTTGSSGIVNVQIKNIGSGFGTFDYYASCTTGLSQSGKVPDKLQMAAGQALTGQLYITGTASQDTTGSCTINAYDVNNPTNKDSATVTAKIKTICEATEPVGTKKCSGATIVQSDGCRYQIVQSCANGCEYQNGQPQCKETTGGGTCTPNWQASAWSSCVNGVQTRSAYDANNCNVTTGKPTLTQSCGTGGGDTGNNAIVYLLAVAAVGLLLYGAFGNKMKW